MNRTALTLYFIFTIITGLSAIFFRYRCWRVYRFVKPLPLIGIIIFVAGTALNNRVPPGLRLLLIPGLVMGLAGDIFLLNDRFFLPGLFSFLLGHAFYAIAIFKGVCPAGLTFCAFITAVSIMYTVIFVKKIRPEHKKMLPPVIAYIMMLTLMLQISLNHDIRLGVFPWFAVGAFFFYISDAIFAVDRFVHKFKPAHAIILSAYYLAQAFIGAGAMAVLK